MSEKRFIKSIDSEESEWLAEKYPFAFLLLWKIAIRARRYSGHPDGLQVGDAIIGDPKSTGMSRQNYRTAIKKLVEKKFIKIIYNGKKFIEREKSTIKLTIKGMIVNILDSRIWDINPESSNHHINQQLTNSQPTANHKQERIRKNKKEIIRIAQTDLDEIDATSDNIGRGSSQSAPPLRAKISDIHFSFEERRFQNITDQDLEAWKIAYPAAVVSQELLRMGEWCLSNTAKSKSKKQWRKFITNWLSRSNEESINKAAWKKQSFNGTSHEISPENRLFSETISKLYFSENWKLEVLSSYVFISGSGNHPGYTLNYSENGFKEQLKNLLIKTGFKQKREQKILSINSNAV
jgi:hypothetical protein